MPNDFPNPEVIRSEPAEIKGDPFQKDLFYDTIASRNTKIIEFKDVRGGFEVVTSVPAESAPEGELKLYKDTSSGVYRLYARINQAWRLLGTTAGASAGGSDTQVQFNDGGSLGGDADLTWNKTTDTLSLGSAPIVTTITDGDALTIRTKDVSSGSGGLIQVVGGNGTAAGAGGAAYIIAGAGGNDAGAVGGSIVLDPGTSGDVYGDIVLDITFPGSVGGGRIFLGASNENHLCVVLPTVTTTDATVTNIFIATMVASSAVFFEVKVKAIRTGGSAGTAQDSAGYVRRATFKRVGTDAPTLVGAVQDAYTAEDQAGWDCTLAISGNTIVAQVTGAINNNILWHVIAEYTKAT